MFGYFESGGTTFTCLSHDIVVQLIADASGGGPVAVSISGAIAGVAYLAAMLEIGRRSFGRPRADARIPTAVE